MAETLRTVRFRQQEGQLFRIISVGGAYGGITPDGKVYAGVYNDLPPIPSEIVQEVGPEGNLGAVLSRTGDPTIERRFEVGLLMDLNTAIALRDWLDKQVQNLKNIQKAPIDKGE